MMTLSNTLKTQETSITEFVCRFCQRAFRRETTLATHVCEQKHRHQTRHNLDVQLGLQAYLKFYQYNHLANKERGWDDFVTSPYYRAFVKFGHYCYNTQVIAPLQYLDWLLKNNKKIDNWCRDSVYSEFLLQHLKLEAVEDALTRAVKWSISWADTHNANARDCLRYGNTNAICHAITTGKISAWAIYHSDSGRQFLNKISREQLKLIYDYIDPDYWNTKFGRDPDNVVYCRDILTKAGW
jgi:hypothetical protein